MKNLLTPCIPFLLVLGALPAGAAVPAAAATPDAAAQVRPAAAVMGAPGADSAQRAAAALRQALSAQPADALRIGERLVALDAEVASLRQLAARQGADARAALDESRQGAPWLPWLAIALLAAGTGAWVWRRGSQLRPALATPDWFRFASAPGMRPGVAAQRRATTQPDVLRAAPAPAPAPLPSDDDEHDSLAMPVLCVPLEEQPSQPGALGDMADSGGASIKAEWLRTTEFSPSDPALRVLALSEALQEAEFLASVGHGQRAMDVLKAYIAECGHASPLAYLELLQLCVRLGDGLGIIAVRHEYRRVFQREAPDLSEPLQTQAPLDECDAAMQHIARLWQQPEVLDLLQGMLFGSATVLGREASLRTWRELLWLHGIAQEVWSGRRAEGQAAAEEARREQELTLAQLDALDLAASADAFGVDVDLSDVDTARHGVTLAADAPRRRRHPLERDTEMDACLFDAAVATEGRQRRPAHP